LLTTLRPASCGAERYVVAGAHLCNHPLVMEWAFFIALIVAAYLVGAVPSGLLVSRAAGKDILSHGSGKTGTANTLSLIGRGGAALVFTLDLLKGLLVVIAARLLPWSGEALGSLAVGAAGAAAIVGHNWSLWVKLISGEWGGGRGIMVAVGALLGVQPLIVVAVALVGFAALGFRRSVLVATLAGIMAGIGAALVLVAVGWLTPWLLVACLVWGLLVAVGFAS
jgi:acyl phosphate:glycerol-3-phosphate acyltransferase